MNDTEKLIVASRLRSASSALANAALSVEASLPDTVVRHIAEAGMHITDAVVLLETVLAQAKST